MASSDRRLQASTAAVRPRRRGHASHEGTRARLHQGKCASAHPPGTSSRAAWGPDIRAGTGVTTRMPARTPHHAQEGTPSQQARPEPPFICEQNSARRSPVRAYSTNPSNYESMDPTGPRRHSARGFREEAATMPKRCRRRKLGDGPSRTLRDPQSVRSGHPHRAWPTSNRRAVGAAAADARRHRCESGPWANAPPVWGSIRLNAERLAK